MMWAMQIAYLFTLEQANKYKYMHTYSGHSIPHIRASYQETTMI